MLYSQLNNKKIVLSKHNCARYLNLESYNSGNYSEAFYLITITFISKIKYEYFN